MRSELLFAANEMPGGAAAGVKRWYEVWEHFSHVLIPLLARDRSPFSYTDDYFMSAVVAIEEYQRISTAGTRQLPTENHRARVEQVVQLVQEHYPEHASWTKNALQKANQVPFLDRLVDVLDRGEDVTAAMLGTKTAAFARSARDVRVDYAHGTRTETAIRTGEMLYWSAQVFRWLLRLVMLEAIGFEDASDRVQNHNRFRQEAPAIRKAVESIF